MDENTNKEPEIILVEKYKDIPEDQFVPLGSGIYDALPIPTNLILKTEELYYGRL